MDVWEELKGVLLQMREEDPRALSGYPNPRGHQDQRPPFRISLQPWAIGPAEALHRRFGADVRLVVGFLRYPQQTREREPIEPGRDRVPDLDPAEAAVELDGPLAVRSGYTANHALWLTNLGGPELSVDTNGQLTADVVDPDGRDVVGSFAGMQHLPHIQFRVAPGAAGRIPLLVGTGSLVPCLGYAVPAGRWAVQTTLELSDGRRRKTPALPIEVTE
ncbi:MAG: hypothetical protein ACRDX8_00510 [Acidimicrobiales bacterium]